MTTLPQLTQSITTAGLPTPTPSFLTPILTSNSQRPIPLSLHSLLATTKSRLFAADISASPSILLPTTPFLPANINNVRIPSSTLNQDIFVQVLDVEDLSKSKWEQIEDLESERKGEFTKGREVIRIVPEDEVASSASTQFPQQGNSNNRAGGEGSSKGPFKLLMQDWKGTKIYGFELKKVDKIGYPPIMGIGAKLVLKRGCKVARGMVLLEPGTVTVFGGKIEGLDKGWREGREERLRKEVNESRVPELEA